jgi:RNA polymerase sigma-70 factor (ECF subfamily)
LDDHTAQSIVDPADGPDLTLEKKDRRQFVGRCLDRLSPSHRTIIDLVYFHDKSVSEVAEIVQVSESTVKTRMFYARRKLAEVLSPV